VQQLDRAKQMEFQWRGIAWRALHQEPDNQSVEDQPQTQASHYHSHSSRARVSGSHTRYPPPVTHVIKPKAEPTLRLPDKQTRQHLFNRIDTNGTGRVSLAEIDKAVAEGILGQALGLVDLDNKPALMRAFMAADTTRDNFVQQGPDFSRLLFYIVYFNTRWRLFEEFQSSHDRQMDVTDFAAGCAKIGMRLTPEELHSEFATCDTDGCGVILFDDWCSWCAARVHRTERARRAQLRKERSPPQHQDDIQASRTAAPTSAPVQKERRAQASVATAAQEETQIDFDFAEEQTMQPREELDREMEVKKSRLEKRVVFGTGCDDRPAKAEE
jgi:Ca2+-binding EF-hand superfamily protein